MTIEQGFSALIRDRAREVKLDSAGLVEGWTFQSGLGAPQCGYVPEKLSRPQTPIELDLVRPIGLDLGNGRAKLLDGADSGLPTLRRELESWFLGQLSGDERIKEATCGDADGWSLADFRASAAGASHCVLPVGAYKAVMSKVLDTARGPGRTRYQARAGISTGVAYIGAHSQRAATLVVGESFVIRRREDGFVVAEVPRQVKLNYAADYYTRVNFPWLSNGDDGAVNQP